MRLRRPGGDPEPRPDLVVRATRCDQCDNLTLTRRNRRRLLLRGQFDHGPEATPSFEGRLFVRGCNPRCNRTPGAAATEGSPERRTSPRRKPPRSRRLFPPEPAQEPPAEAPAPPSRSSRLRRTRERQEEALGTHRRTGTPAPRATAAEGSRRCSSRLPPLPSYRAERARG